MSTGENLKEFDSAPRSPGGSRGAPIRPLLVRSRGRLCPAALLAGPDRARHRMGAARIQPRAGHSRPVVLPVPARDEVRPPRHGSGHRPQRRRGADRAVARHGRLRQSGAHRRYRLLRAHRLGGRADPDRLRLLPGLGVLAVGAASRLHAALAAVPLLEAQHRAAARLLGGRGLAGAPGGRAGVSRWQCHRPRHLQAAGGRGLLGAQVPLPDHELLLCLRGALPRAGLAQDRAACSPRHRSPC